MLLREFSAVIMVKMGRASNNLPTWTKRWHWKMGMSNAMKPSLKSWAEAAADSNKSLMMILTAMMDKVTATSSDSISPLSLQLRATHAL